MAYTTFDADVAGKMAAMDSSFSGHIPPHFEQDKTLRDAWIEGYNGMASSMDKRCWSPPAPPVRKARKAVVETDAPPKGKPAAKTMSAILDEELRKAKQIA